MVALQIRAASHCRAIWLAVVVCGLMSTSRVWSDEAISPPDSNPSVAAETNQPTEKPVADGAETTESNAPGGNPRQSTSKEDTDPDSPQAKKRRERRAIATTALGGLIILGFAMVALTWLGARFTRRYMFGPSGQPQRLKPTAVREDDWAAKPIVKAVSNEHDPED